MHQDQTKATRGITLGFVAISLLCAVIVLSSWYELQRTTNAIDRIVNIRIVQTQLLYNMRWAARERTRLLYDIALEEDVFLQDEKIQRFYHFGREFGEARTVLLQQVLEKRESDLLEKQRKLTEEAIEYQTASIELVLQDNIKQARNILVNYAIPQQNKVIAVIDELIDFNQAYVQSVKSDTLQATKQSQLLIVSLLAAVFVLVIFVAYFSVRYLRYFMRKVNEQQKIMQQAREKAEKDSDAKSHFISRVSHELRTPMNAVMGFSQLLQVHPVVKKDEQLTENVSTLLYSSKHMLKIINELLDLSRIELGQIRLDKENFDICRLLVECCEIIEPLAREKKIAIIKTASMVKPILIHSDRQRMMQAIMNLLSNAIKYNTTNGKVALDCRLQPDGNICLSVADTGSGIARENYERVFEPFDRLDKDYAAEGTGVGLALTKALIELLGGIIYFKSELGKGSTFYLQLPVK